jgi:hypothetical protein
MEKTIQDPIHGAIRVDGWIVQVLDTFQVQRLRNIKQLGFASLVYPGANHTRFEHSIGAMHIAKLLTNKMDVDEQTKREIVVAALIHDVGHAPFSHSSEKIVRKYLRTAHEDVGHVVRGSEIEDVLKEEGLNIRSILDHIKGKSHIGIVSGDIDADRMDYLVRDSYYTGVAYGVFDIMRLINKIYFDDGLVIDGGGLRAAESLLISRFMMNPTVYFHHVCRIARKMYEKAVEYLIEEGLIDAKELLRMDDHDIVAFLRNQKGYPAEIMWLIDSRKLFKRAIYVGRQRISGDILRVSVERAEKEIAEMAKVESKYVMVDISPMEEARELKAMLNIEGELVSLEEASPLVRALKEAEREVWKMGVYTKKEYVEKVAKAAADYFGIERVPMQKRLDEIS